MTNVGHSESTGKALSNTMHSSHHELPPSDHRDSGEHLPDLQRIQHEKEVNDSPIEQVRLTVSIDDDPTQSVLTFRTWVLGLTACIVLSFLNQFFTYRNSFITVSSVTAQITVLPIGRLMAATLPTKPVRVPLTNWTFSLNPGPFNMKEHALITIFAGAGSGGVYALNTVTIVKVFYKRSIHPAAALLLAQTTQLLGYGWAGVFRKYLVDSPYMWWPGNLVQVSLFRALHEEEKRPKGGLSKLQFFLLIFVASFAYYIIPGYFFPSITALSFVCWVWKDSVTAQQIGSGANGLGIGSIALDWSTITMYAGNPLATPAFAIFNMLVGYIFIMYVLMPISYWSNSFNATRFPILSARIFDFSGQPYNTSRIIDEQTFAFDSQGYDGYTKINLSIFFASYYGLSFAVLTATLSHVALFNGRLIYQSWRQTASTTAEKIGDVHTRLMKKNYEAVPQWWFLLILVIVLGLSFFTCEGFNKQLQLPYWGILLACGVALTFTLPIGVIVATTNQMPGLDVITELMIGYLYPGRPLANVTFKTYGYISMSNALTFLGDFKLGHYMKIPPKSMFIVQLVGTLVASFVYFGTAWWLLESIENICDISKLPRGSPWTCPGYDVFYSASIIWGVAGPLRMFGRLGLYPVMNYYFFIGLLAPVPVWLLSRAYPEKKWIKLINIPVILSGTGGLPVAKTAGVLPWYVLAITFNILVYRRYKNWWSRYTYVLSAGLDAGVAFLAVLSFLALQAYNIDGLNWWGGAVSDHCPLAACPTAPGVVVQGCPVH